MEGPTPVSSLLHSSTIVVARVYLMILLGDSMQIVLVLVILSMNLVGHFDVKKNIAYSTSIHLIVIFLLGILEIYSGVVIYIILHRIIKRQIFQGSGYSIHRVGRQDIRKFNGLVITYMIIIRIIMLSALVRMVIVGAKELVVLRRVMLVIVFVVVSSMIYSVRYVNKLGMIRGVGEVEG
jgi:NADH-ubiquinone oxidoreductase chain 5